MRIWITFRTGYASNYTLTVVSGSIYTGPTSKSWTLFKVFHVKRSTFENLLYSVFQNFALKVEKSALFYNLVPKT